MVAFSLSLAGCPAEISIGAPIVWTIAELTLGTDSGFLSSIAVVSSNAPFSIVMLTLLLVISPNVRSSSFVLVPLIGSAMVGLYSQLLNFSSRSAALAAL